MGGRDDCADVDEYGIDVLDVIEVVKVVAPLDLLNLGSAKNSSTLKQISLKRAARSGKK